MRRVGQFRNRIADLVERTIGEYELAPALANEKVVASLEKLAKIADIMANWGDDPAAEIVELSDEELLEALADDEEA